ncbi:hypothetical protein AMEJIAPC_01592 [Caulobacter sp. NIBR1757]|nr:hypothetical protein AMEJIAPC_01592 [Caulobacter sp. NIBR1757]
MLALLEADVGVYVPPSVDSVATIQAQIAREPNDADLWHSLGQSLWRDKRFDDAIKAFQTAAQSPPKHIGRGYLYRDLAEALEARGRKAEALQAARKMLLGWPISKQGHGCDSFETRLFVRVLLKNGQTAEAAAIYKTVSAQKPSDARCRQISKDLATPA